MANAGKEKVVVIVPTYNEKENIDCLVERVLALDNNIELVVVDDDSPDGTWRVVAEKAKEEPRLHLLHRRQERGRGKAGIAGFRYALNEGADFVIEMDGDLSHDPSDIPMLLQQRNKFDIIVGSRMIKGGADSRCGIQRRLISRLAGWYIRTLLGLKVVDPTSGFRCFSRKALEKMELDKVRAEGPFVVTETLFRCHRRGMEIGEVPIVFWERGAGSSKLGTGTLLKYLWQVIWLRFRRA